MKKTPTRLLAASLMTLLCLAGRGLAQENYSSWLNYHVLTVNTSATAGGANVGETQLNFPLLVRLNASNFTFAHAKGTGADVRFSKADGTTHLKYQIEHWDSAGQDAEVWVLMDSVKGNNALQTLRVYSGKSTASDSSNGAAVFSTSNYFQGVFHLGEATGDTARDATANHFKGVPRNKGGTNPTDTVGAIGHAKNFMGSEANNNGGSYQILTSTGGNTYTSNALNFKNDSSTVSGAALYTISAWMYVSAFPSGTSFLKAAVAKSLGSPPTNQYYLRLRDPAVNQINAALDTMRVDFNDGVPSVYKSGVNPISAGNWMYVAAVRNGIKGDSTHLRTWVNGYAPASESNTSISNSIQQPYNVYIGSFSNDSGYFNGKLDEVEFSDTARDSSWLLLSYQTQKPGSAVVTVAAESLQVQPLAPTSVTYRTNPVTLTAGNAMGADTATVLPAGATGVTYSVSPALPAGLSLSTSTGIITGTPTAGVAVSTVIDSVTATNGAGSVKVGVSITVNATPTITTQPAAVSFSIPSALTYKMFVKTTGTTPMTYKWIRTRGATIDTLTAAPFSRNATGDTLTIAGATALVTDSGQIKCLVTNVAGSATSNNAHLAVSVTGIWGTHVVHVQGLSPFMFHVPTGNGVSNVSMSVENMDGRVVWSKEYKVGASGVVGWNGGGSDGRPVSSGMYVVKLRLISVDNKTLGEVKQTGVNE